jgi:hypothetical protein
VQAREQQPGRMTARSSQTEHDGSTISANSFQTTSAGKPTKTNALAGEILKFRSFDPTFSRAARLQQRLQP